MPATATLKIAARVTLIATPNRPTVNDILTLTARVAEIAGNPFPATGTVTFFDGSRRLGAGTLAAATASWAGRLREGRQRLSATYTGDAYYTRGQSPRLDVIVTVAAAGASAIRPSQPGTRPASTGPTGIGVSLVLATTAILAGLFLLAQARRGRH
jgi:hypothetical protein